jgi:hypothetical protein
MSPTDNCSKCTNKDTLQHRLTKFGDGKETWDWTKKKMASILRLDPRHILEEWTTRPQFKLWPPQRHRVVLWFVANVALYRNQVRKELTHIDFMDFLRRKRWKLDQHPKRRELVGNYLQIIDMIT